MAVQAQYPSNLLLLNRSGEQEKKEMDYSQQPSAFFEQAPLFFANGANGNQRKRTRESPASTSAFQMVPNPQIQMNLYSPSIQSPALINLAQLQNQTHHHHPPPPPSLVSTGLKLSFEDNHRSQNQSQSQPNPFIQQDLASLINHQRDEIEHYLITQGEQLRRTLADRTSRHYRALLAAAEETAARRLREKDIELNRALQKTAELEERIARLRNESLTWQSKAITDHATASSLHAQIEQATAMACNKAEECGDSWAEDCESAHVDPGRVEDRGRACRVCGVSGVSVVLLPCRHLCLCSACDAAAGNSDAACCPVCHAVTTGSVQVFLS